MKHRGIVVISTIGLLLLPGGREFGVRDLLKAQPMVGSAHPTVDAQLQQLAESITVRVIRENGAGSGTLIAKDGQVYTVLTNAHVVRPGKPHRIETPDGKSYPAQIVKVTEHAYDMAILQFQAAADYQVVSIASSPGKVSEPVFAAGFPSEARSLLFTRGVMQMYPSVALRDGYQIGYTNDIQQGMSGGPVLNGAGELIGINGMNAFVILQSAYQFVDGSYPSDAVRSEMNRLSWGVPIGRLAEVDPSFAENFSPERPSLTGVAAEVRDMARQITVRIEMERKNGSGVIIAQQGNTYYVLTAGHVMRKKREYEVVAHDGKRYPVNYELVSILEGADMAVLQFQSNESYRVATLSNYRLRVEERPWERPWVFLSGWPGLKAGEMRSADPEFTAGRIFSKERGSINAKNTKSLTETNGYELVYTNPAQGGMSGGPVLDASGRVIGIHAAAEAEFIFEERAHVQLGFSLGVPVRTLLSLASKADVKAEWLKVESLAPPPLNRGEVTGIREALFTAKRPPTGAKATDWINYGNQLWRLFEFEEAVTAFDEAIKLKPEFEQAWYGRGLALSEQSKYQEAVASFDKATEINPRLYEAWRKRGEALYRLKRYPEVLTSLDKAINLKPEDSVLYALRGNLLQKLERYAEAVEAYSQAIEIKPHPFAYTNRGLVRSDLGDLSEAIADYNKAIEINPYFVEAYNNRGGARYNLGDLLGAIADYNKAIEIDKNFAKAYNNRGVVRSKLGELQRAIADYNKAIEINPYFVEAYNKRGNARSDLGDLSGAIADYTKAIEINPEYASAYYNRGGARKNLGNLSEAIADYTKAIEINPEYALAYNNRGVAGSELGDLQGAMADYNKAIEINPDHASSYNNRGMARSKLGDLSGAMADYNKAIEINPDYPLAYYNRGIVRKNLGDLSGAIADYTKAIEINPDYPLAYNNRGVVLYILGEDKKAIADYTKAIEINPDDPFAYNNRGNARINLGEYSEAIADYNKAIEIHPDYAEAYYNRGIARDDLGNLQEAMADYNKAIEINPDYAYAYFSRGLARYKLGDSSGAMADYNKAIEINPDYAEAYYSRGNARINLGEYSKAMADYNKAIEINPDYAEAYGNRGLLYDRLGDRQRAIADMRKAAQLFCEQRSPNCQKAQELLRQLQQQ